MEAPEMAQDQPKKRRRDRARESKHGRDLLTIDDLDRRTQAAARAVSLRDQIIADRGGKDGLSALEIEQIENAVMTTTILRSLQLRWSKKEPSGRSWHGYVLAISQPSRLFM